MTDAAREVITAVRRLLPIPPPAPRRGRGGPQCGHPPTDDPADAATVQWHRRQAARQTEVAQVHRLAEQGLSQRAITRQTGLHRQTVKHMLAQEILPPAPPVTPPGPPAVTALPLTLDETPPPAPWQSWADVRQVREDLKEHRFLLLRRPDHLTREEKAIVATLLGSSVGPHLQVAYQFVQDWYAFWRDDEGARRPPEEARSRYQAWQGRAAYRALSPLRRVLERVTEAHFTKVSHFLHHVHWEATNNGAEQGGRGFRHEEAAHFRLRSTQAITDTLTAQALLRKEQCTTPRARPHERKARGRLPAPGLAA